MFKFLELIGDTGEFEERGLIPQIDRPMSMPYLCCKVGFSCKKHILTAVFRCGDGKISK